MAKGRYSTEGRAGENPAMCNNAGRAHCTGNNEARSTEASQRQDAARRCLAARARVHGAGYLRTAAATGVSTLACGPAPIWGR